jgi:alpha-D-xyloside xylohydrolase
MDDYTRDWWLRPATAHDPERVLDRLNPIEVDQDGRLRATTASGKQITGVVTRAEGGALRVRLALEQALLDATVDSWLLDAGYTETPADIDEARERLAGLSCMALLGTLTGGGLGTGVVLNLSGRQIGWQVSMPLLADDAVYGGGECFQGLDLRGRVRRCVNLETHGAAGLDASYLTVPLFWTSGGAGIFVNTGAPLRADLGATHADVLALTADDGVLDVFLYAGEPADIVAQHVAVTGRTGSVPDWAFGVWTSRCSYFSADEVDRILDGYEAADCPVDVVHVDAWQVGDVIADLSTAWEIDRDRFPAGWGKRLADRGVRLSLWHNPYLRAGTAAGDEAIAHGYVLVNATGDPVATNDMPGRLLVDFTNAEARAWWRALVADLVTNESAASVKGDFAEEVPPSAVASDGRTGWQLRNSYAVGYQRESHAALRSATGADAAIMFNRSGSAGAQRYPGHWVGDTPSTWSGLASALRATLSLSMSGFAVVGSDIGGFWTERRVSPLESATVAWDESSYDADVDPELFVRWTQWGALSPLMRFHGTGKREPWAYPAPFGELAVAATRLRPRLRGYLATVAAESASSGTPMMRPMPLAFPDARDAKAATLQYLLGPDVLVAPVLQPGGEISLWVPPGEWIGIAGAPDLDGDGWVSLTLGLDALPGWSRRGVEVVA